MKAKRKRQLQVLRKREEGLRARDGVSPCDGGEVCGVEDADDVDGGYEGEEYGGGSGLTGELEYVIGKEVKVRGGVPAFPCTHTWTAAPRIRFHTHTMLAPMSILTPICKSNTRTPHPHPHPHPN